MVEHKFNGFIYQVYEDASSPKDVFKIVSDKNKSVPNNFFKYCSFSPYSLDSFINHFIYATHPWEFNDPFDCNRSLISFEKTSLDDILALN